MLLEEVDGHRNFVVEDLATDESIVRMFMAQHDLLDVRHDILDTRDAMVMLEVDSVDIPSTTTTDGTTEAVVDSRFNHT